MVIHAFIFLSDHFHMLLSPLNAKQLSDFMGYVDSNIARKAGRLARWRDKFWGRRYQSIVISNEEAVQESRLRYILANGCKEGLVASPRDWPGASVTSALLRGAKTLKGKWFNHTKEYRSRKSRLNTPSESIEVVTLSPLPCWTGLTEVEIRQRVLTIVKDIEKETAQMHAEKGTAPKGAKKVVKQYPHDVPKDMKYSPSPQFITATREAMRELRKAYKNFVAAYREAADKLRAGHLTATFPPNSFPPPQPYVPAEAPG
jgi:hypothetical protein